MQLNDLKDEKARSEDHESSISIIKANKAESDVSINERVHLKGLRQRIGSADTNLEKLVMEPITEQRESVEQTNVYCESPDIHY